MGITLVAGPPCSGKSTWVRGNADAGALVIDYDRLAEAIGGGYGDDRLRPLVRRVCDLIVGELAADPGRWGDAWLIRGAPTADERRRYRERLGAEVVVLAVPADECKRRAVSAGRPSSWAQLIDAWWQRYEPDPADVVLGDQHPPKTRRHRMSVHKSYRAALLKAGDENSTDAGTFEALVSVFGNVDLAGDRVVKGAFAKSLERWGDSGDPIPILWAHQWDNPQAHLGGVLEAEERDDGLWIRGKLDVDERDTYASLIWRKMKSRLVREFSFAYDVLDEKAADDGANELLELELLEVGPCLKGVNPNTQLLAVKREPSELGAGGKAGRVLSAKNEQDVRQAVTLLTGVLDRLDSQPANTDDEPAKAPAKPPKGGEEPEPRSPFSIHVLAQADAL